MKKKVLYLSEDYDQGCNYCNILYPLIKTYDPGGIPDPDTSGHLHAINTREIRHVIANQAMHGEILILIVDVGTCMHIPIRERTNRNLFNVRRAHCREVRQLFKYGVLHYQGASIPSW